MKRIILTLLYSAAVLGVVIYLSQHFEGKQKIVIYLVGFGLIALWEGYRTLKAELADKTKPVEEIVIEPNWYEIYEHSDFKTWQDKYKTWLNKQEEKRGIQNFDTSFGVKEPSDNATDTEKNEYYDKYYSDENSKKRHEYYDKCSEISRQLPKDMMSGKQYRFVLMNGATWSDERKTFTKEIFADGKIYGGHFDTDKEKEPELRFFVDDGYLVAEFHHPYTSSSDLLNQKPFSPMALFPLMMLDLPYDCLNIQKSFKDYLKYKKAGLSKQVELFRKALTDCQFNIKESETDVYKDDKGRYQSFDYDFGYSVYTGKYFTVKYKTL